MDFIQGYSFFVAALILYAATKVNPREVVIFLVVFIPIFFRVWGIL